MTARHSTPSNDADRFDALQRQLAAVTAENAALVEQLSDAELKLKRVHAAYLHALERLKLQQRRLYVSNAERPDEGEQLAFESMFEQVRKLSEQLDAAAEAAGDHDETSNDSEGAQGEGGKGDKGDRPKRKRGRRNLEESDLPVQRIEIFDDTLEGVAERVTFEESSRLGYLVGGPCRIVIARMTYKDTRPEVREVDSLGGDPAPAKLFTAAMPPELFRRSLLAPSMIAHLMASKYMLGVPFYRLEQTFRLQGFSLDRGTMSRYAEEVGATVGAIVLAARDNALANAFCLSTDATGVRIQPGPLIERGNRRGPCHKGHFFVVLADKDHVFFEYQRHHTSAAACEMFRGFTGYIQADGHAIYDALFAGRAPRGSTLAPVEGPPPKEVGCWSHCRRGFWEAAVCKHPEGVEGLRRIDLIFAADRALADLPPARRKVRREALVRPLVDAFFAWVDAELVRPRVRGHVASALGYARNQASALRRFLEDGRLKLDNNGASEAVVASRRGADESRVCAREGQIATRHGEFRPLRGRGDRRPASARRAQPVGVPILRARARGR